MAAQEIPLANVTKFDSGANFRTNVCERQRMVYNGEKNITYALEGLNLSVAITQYTKPYEDAFFNLDENGRIPSPGSNPGPGLFVTIMDEVAKRARFQWRNSFVAVEAVDLSAANVNKTWSDLLEWQVNTFDISVE